VQEMHLIFPSHGLSKGSSWEAKELMFHWQTDLRNSTEHRGRVCWSL